MKKVFKLFAEIMILAFFLGISAGCEQNSGSDTDNLTGISITQQPVKTTYFAGESFDKTGLKVTATYESGKTIDISESVEISEVDLSTAIENKVITVTYEDKSATFNITVVAIVLSSIEVTTPPEKISYYVDDSFNGNGMVVTAAYNNGTKKVIKDSEYTTDFASQVESEGTKTVTVTYSGKTAVFTVTVSTRPVVDTPVFSVVSKTIVEKGSTVTITCSTNDSQIRYTTNGDDPTASSTLYTEPIKIDEQMKIKAIATKAEYTKSQIVIAQYYVPYEFTEEAVLLENYSGTAGVSGSEITNSLDHTVTPATYYKFGDWPQTIKEADVIVNEALSITRGAFTYYKGSDANYYVKCLENALVSQYTYSDGTQIAMSSEKSYKYFKVEPIIWRCLDSETGLFVAEKSLTASVPYYVDENERKIGETIIYPNNYKYSTIRAYLNGSYESDDTQSTTYKDAGFLQSAFTSGAMYNMYRHVVDNSVRSTRDVTTRLPGASKYYVDNTADIIFLLSEYEVTNYSHERYDENYERENSRIRKTTDFSKANGSLQYIEEWGGGSWWLRTPYSDDSRMARFVSVAGNAGEMSVSEVNSLKIGIVPALYYDFNK